VNEDVYVEEKVKGRRTNLLSYPQALAVIANLRRQERIVHTKLSDAGLHHMSEGPSDRGRFYQTATAAKDNLWGFDQNTQETKPGCQRKRLGGLPDLFLKQHTRLLHRNLSQRRFQRTKIVLEVYKIVAGHPITELHYLKALYGTLGTNSHHLKQSCIPGLPKKQRDGKCRSIQSVFSLPLKRVDNVRSKQTVTSLGTNTMTSVMKAHNEDLNQFGTVCDWCTSRNNEANMKKRAGEGKDQFEKNTPDNDVLETLHTDAKNTTVEMGSETLSEWCNGEWNSRRLLSVKGVMAWSNQLTEAVLKDTFKSKGTTHQFKEYFIRQMGKSGQDGVQEKLPIRPDCGQQSKH